MSLSFRPAFADFVSQETMDACVQENNCIALISVAIGLVVVEILKLVYLYRTAKLFREYSVRLRTIEDYCLM